MAYAASSFPSSAELAFPAPKSLPESLQPLRLFRRSMLNIRKRIIFHRVLAELQEYSERSLKDFGADHGVKEFARRAAGL